MTLYHATAVELEGQGILILGDSGMGKSDLAIRLIDKGATLVADDYCEISLKDQQLHATAPKAIKGKIEAFGIGILNVSHKEEAVIHHVVELKDNQDLERMPEKNSVEIEGQTLPLIYLCAKQPSAVAKLCLYIKNLK